MPKRYKPSAVSRQPSAVSKKPYLAKHCQLASGDRLRLSGMALPCWLALATTLTGWVLEFRDQGGGRAQRTACFNVWVAKSL
jgi:hypothetical protein